MTNTFDRESEIVEIFKIAIVEELLGQFESNIPEEVIQKVWDKCNGNPWNANVIYRLMKVTNDLS